MTAYDEMRTAAGAVRPAYSLLSNWLGTVPKDVLDYRRREAEFIFRRIGITFAVYGDAAAQEPAFTNRATDLKERPAADSRTLSPLAIDSAVKVLSRQGAWTQVEAGGKRGSGWAWIWRGRHRVHAT